MRTKQRGNGQGCAVRVRKNCWKAIATIGYINGKAVRRTKTGFLTKSDALAYIPTLKKERPAEAKKMTLRGIYELWFDTLKVSASTMSCYKSGFAVFDPVSFFRTDQITIDDLQRCIDTCGKGARTQQNAKVALGLVYKFGIPRGLVSDGVNLAQFLKVEGTNRSESEKQGFSQDQLDMIRSAIGTVPYADYIYIDCYLGFRPSEFFDLKKEDYDPQEHCFVGGAKTEAGKNRSVTVSPKILFLVRQYVDRTATGQTIFRINGKRPTASAYRNAFDQALKQIGITDEHITPHSCRHTFATLMKSVSAPDTDKLRLIGHTSTEMLKYYQDTRLDDLRTITDKL